MIDCKKIEKITSGYKKDLPLPLNYQEKTGQLFLSSRKIKAEDINLFTFKNSYISWEAAIFKGFRIYPNSIFHSDAIKVFLKFSKKLNFWRQNYLKYKTIKIEEALYISDAWSQINYYHWFSVLMRLELALSYISNQTILVVPEGKYPLKKQIMLQSLKTFGFEKDRIIFLKRGYKVKAKKIIMPSHVGIDYFRSDLIDKVRSRIIKYYQDDLKLDLGKNIYINRIKANYRKVENENEVIKKLKQYDFKSIDMENYSFIEQISIMHHAKNLISIHGAGLMNSIFMNKNSNVLELLGQTLNRPCFYILISSSSLNYSYQRCNQTTTNDDNSNIIVDLEELEQNINLIKDKNRQ